MTDITPAAVKALADRCATDAWYLSGPGRFMLKYRNMIADNSSNACEMLRALSSELARVTAERDKMREAHKENARLLMLVGSDLQGRIEAGKLAALRQCYDRAEAAAAGREAG